MKPTPMIGSALPTKPATIKLDTISARRSLGAIWLMTCKLPL
jgi:hypothetical protein